MATIPPVTSSPKFPGDPLSLSEVISSVLIPMIAVCRVQMTVVHVVDVVPVLDDRMAALRGVRVLVLGADHVRLRLRHPHLRFLVRERRHQTSAPTYQGSRGRGSHEACQGQYD